MPSSADETKGQLRSLRDQLAFEAPRARNRPQAPPELTRRLQDALESVGRIFGLWGSSTAPVSASFDEVAADTLVEGRLVMTDWEGWIARDHDKPRAPASTLSPAQRRLSERHDTTVTVKLLRHIIRGGGSGLELTLDTISRPAINVSQGGIFVTASAADLLDVRVGSVLHVAVAPSASRSFHLRGAVTRRDATGLAMRWILESPADEQAAGGLVEAIRAAKAK